VYSKICDVCFSKVVADSHTYVKKKTARYFQDPKDKLLKKKQPTATYDNYCDYCDWVVVSIFFVFTPNFGEMIPNLTVAYVSNGLVQPPTR